MAIEIVSFPMKSMVIFHSYVKLPKGRSVSNFPKSMFEEGSPGSLKQNITNSPLAIAKHHLSGVSKSGRGWGSTVINKSMAIGYHSFPLPQTWWDFWKGWSTPCNSGPHFNAPAAIHVFDEARHANEDLPTGRWLKMESFGGPEGMEKIDLDWPQAHPPDHSSFGVSMPVIGWKDWTI